ncbi:hypothetical protein D3C76_824120 [compost metagenome]
MHVDDLLQRSAVGEGDVVEEAAAQEGVRQFFFVVRGDDDDRALLGLDGLVCFVDVELHLVELLQQVVGELDVGLVDFVDQQNHPLLSLESLPELALFQVVAYIVDFLGTQLRIAQAADRIVFVEALVGLGGGFDVPGDQAGAEGGGELLGEHSLAGARFAFDQQRAFEGDGRVYRQFQVVCGDVVAGAFELHGSVLCGVPGPFSTHRDCITPVGAGLPRERAGPGNTCLSFVSDYTPAPDACKRRPGIQSLNAPSRAFSQAWAQAAHSAH